MIIKMVRIAVNFISGLPITKTNIHPIKSSRQLITGELLYLPSCQMSQYGQGIHGGDNSTENKHSVDCLYIGPRENGSSHWVLSLKIRQRIQCNEFISIPINKETKERIDELGKLDLQPDEINIIITTKD